jgi:hypothetical protein
MYSMPLPEALADLPVLTAEDRHTLLSAPGT